MTPILEFEGKSVKNAIEKACAELNMPKEKLRHDVISYGSTGIFGLVGTKKAKIRVTLPEPTVEVDSESLDNEQRVDSCQGETEKNESPRIQPLSDDAQVVAFQQDSAELGRDVLQRIIDFITTDATIAIKDESDKLLFKIEGGNPAVLIGKRGQTLEAIQYLVEKIINKHFQERIRIQIDVEGYLETKRDSLQRLALRLSEKAKRTGKPATIGQINAHDRKIIHLALKDDNGVRTQSMGDNYYRKLVIFPRKNNSQKKRSH